MGWTDAYELRDHQTFTQQSVLNVWHVERSDASVVAGEIITAYIDTVMPDIRAIQPDTLDHTLIECQSLSEPTDFASATFTPSAGLLAGTTLTAFNAAAIQFNRRRTDMKNGQKRWVAGNEAQAVGNLWAAGFMVLLNALGTKILTTWQRTASPGVPVCEYVIVQRVCDKFDTEGRCVKYRLPETLAEYLSYQPLTFIARDTIRSQTSRKRLI